MWAPWRMSYILSSDKPDECIFCAKPAEDRDQSNGILFRGRTCYVILNAYPYNPGHLMVVPYRHVASVVELGDDEIAELMLLSRLAVGVLGGAMSPDGLNLGINQGRGAGAGIAGHVHQHVVPRWSEDTNFMTTAGHTRVLPELVEETYRKLAPLFVEAGTGHLEKVRGGR